MKAARFKPDIFTYTALLAAYHPAHKWRQALQVLPLPLPLALALAFALAAAFARPCTWPLPLPLPISFNIAR